MSSTDAEILMLLTAHMLALGVGIMVFFWILYLHRRSRSALKPRSPGWENFQSSPALAIRPASWLVVRTLEPEIVRAALPAGEIFHVSPRVNGWVIVTGPGLPNPGEDVDGCFRFLTGISRKLGHVQFFHVDKPSAHHAWARLDEGCVTRAYAWAGETLWNQGLMTHAEKGLGMKCFAYGEDSETGFWTTRRNAAANVEKIPLLAARWSLDPRVLHRAGGMAGESSRLY